MKKSYFLMAAAAALFAACSETDFVNEATVAENSPSKAIGFDPFAGKTTRAEFTDAASLQVANDGFVVWGYYGADGFTTPATTVFDGVDVSWVDGAWTYDNAKYWNTAKFYKFYAIAPQATTETYTMVNAENGYVKIAGAASVKATASKDYLITRGANQIAGSSLAPVGLDFHHTMAKITVAVKRSSTSEITVNSVTMTGWDNAAGTFTQNSATTPASLNCTEWELAAPSVAGTAEFLTDSESAIVLSTDAASELTTKYICVPQTIAASTLTFTVNYTIDGTDYEKTGVVAAAQTWGTDSHTTYTISIGEPKIEFQVNSVCGWCVPSTGGTTIQNN